MTEEKHLIEDLAKKEREPLMITLIELCAATEMRADFDQERIVRTLAADGWDDYLSRLNHLVHFWFAGFIEFDNEKRLVRVTQAGQEKGAALAKSAREYAAAHPELLADAVSEETH
jgi:hypothetical protein